MDKKTKYIKQLDNRNGYFSKELHLYFFVILLVAASVVSLMLIEFYTLRERELLFADKERMLSQTVMYTDLIMKEVETVADTIWTSSEVQSLQAADVENATLFKFRDFMNDVSNIALSVNTIYRVDVYFSDSNVLVTSADGVFYDVDNELVSYYQKCLSQMSKAQWRLDYADHFIAYANRKRDIVTFMKPIYSTSTGRKYGLVCISVPLTVFKELISMDDNQSEGFIIAQDSRLIIDSFSNDLINSNWNEDSGIFKQIKSENTGNLQLNFNGKKYIYVYTTSEYSKWKFITYYIYDFPFIIKMPVLLFALCILVLFGAAYLMIIRIFGEKVMVPVDTLVSAMRKVEQGEFGVQINQNRPDVFGYIFSRFDNMSLRINTLVEELIQEKVQIKEGKLRLLQSQVRPHFIYNIFNNMIWMLEQHRYDELEQMICATAGYYKTSLNYGNHSICIADNVRQLQYYSQIQKIRFTGQFECSIDFEQDILSMCIPNLLLQPLLENAILHGAAKVTDKVVKISVKGYSKEGNLYFEVCDDGIGISKQRLEDINKAIKDENYHGEDYFALLNIANRLRLYYHNRASITIGSVFSQGTKVTIQIPEEESHV